MYVFDLVLKRLWVAVVLDLPILLLMAVQDINLQQFPQMSVPSAVKVNWLFNYSGLASVQLV